MQEYDHLLEIYDCQSLLLGVYDLRRLPAHEGVSSIDYSTIVPSIFSAEFIISKSDDRIFADRIVSVERSFTFNLRIVYFPQ